MKDKGTISGAVRMVRQDGQPHDYQLRVDIEFTVNGQWRRQYAYGFGNNLKDCWLDMFGKFNEQWNGVYITNGKLGGHEIEWIS